MKQTIRKVWGYAGDAGWFLLGLVTWALCLGAASVTVKNKATGNQTRIPGWLWLLRF